ncbi:uncharacterized protein N0V89_002319 [Didymosphaeria variabile]|uniref:RRM domain-containing protein n=1 Tax=Didymosphaeria variabile TaxID=1932322 RepID=A0A9W9CEJ9_9PLEO|nr:uncharacterized protein N0V89_002319 [Didymosphaeria variabile]KAJ4357743.1 hypothetical protein N0V89_002319 [Didymosphaeria variabile]
MDRFRYDGDTSASVELTDEQQAQKAVQVLNGNDSLGSPVYLRPLNPEFDWDAFHTADRTYSRFVREDEAGTRKAVQPFIEGRRVRIAVKSPAWGNKGESPTQRRDTDLKALERAFDRFGIESISRLTPQFGHTTYQPKFFCHIDFTTKEGADEAIRAIHDTEIEGVLVWAKRSEVDSTKAFQIGKVDKGLLVELQEKGLAPPDSEIHPDWVSKSAKKDPMNFDRHRNWQDKTRPPHKRAYRSKYETVETAAE